MKMNLKSLTLRREKIGFITKKPRFFASRFLNYIMITLLLCHGLAQAENTRISYFYITFSPEFMHTQHTDFMKFASNKFDERNILRQYEAALLRNNIDQISRHLHHVAVRGPFDSLSVAKGDFAKLQAETLRHGSIFSGFVHTSSTGTGLFSFTVADHSILRIWIAKPDGNTSDVQADAVRQIVTSGTSHPRVHATDITIRERTARSGVMEQIDQVMTQVRPTLVLVTLLSDSITHGNAAAIEDAIQGIFDQNESSESLAFVNFPESEVNIAKLAQSLSGSSQALKAHRTLRLSVNPGDQRQQKDNANALRQIMKVLLTLSPPRLAINEVMSSNRGFYDDPFGDDGDWIEIYNAGDVPVALPGLFLSDDPSQPLKWRIPLSEDPAADLLPPGDFKIIWADGDIGKGAEHASFKLNKDGEPVILTDVDGTTTIDFVTLERMASNQSFGRKPDGKGAFVEQSFPGPTPGAPNGVYLISRGGDPKYIHPKDVRVFVVDRPDNTDRNGVPYLASFADALSVFDSTAFEIEPGWTQWSDVTDASPHIILLHINGFKDPERPTASVRLVREFVNVVATDTEAHLILYSGAMSGPGSGSSEYVMKLFHDHAAEVGIDLTDRLSTFALNWDWRESPYPGASFPDSRIAEELRYRTVQQYLSLQRQSQ